MDGRHYAKSLFPIFSRETPAHWTIELRRGRLQCIYFVQTFCRQYRDTGLDLQLCRVPGMTIAYLKVVYNTLYSLAISPWNATDDQYTGFGGDRVGARLAADHMVLFK